MTTLASHSPSTSSTPSIIAPHATDLTKASILQGTGAAKPSLSTVPSGCTSNITQVVEVRNAKLDNR
jgi:hypothetical protein